VGRDLDAGVRRRTARQSLAPATRSTGYPRLMLIERLKTAVVGAGIVGSPARWDLPSRVARWWPSSENHRFLRRAARCRGSVIATEWPVYRDLDWAVLRSLMRRPLVIDGRRLVSRTVLRRAGYEVVRLGDGVIEGTTSDIG
jgi:hypothetical protein